MDKSAYNEVWKRVLDNLRDDISEKSIKTWLNPIKVCEASEGRLILEVPNEFYKDWIRENYETAIREKLNGILNSNTKIEYTISKQKNREEPLPDRNAFEDRRPYTGKNSYPGSTLNPKYSFSTFVVGPGNQFAHAASLAVSQNPGKIYNPLFIYGGVGLGKTHILNAIGNEIKENKPNLNIVYVSAEFFVNDLVSSIRNENMGSFRKKYRRADVLLIDDVQFIAGKDRTQEELFHTYNQLYNENKQIVLTSDRYPNEMSDVEERLRSRFQWGLVADIQPPDLETRIAILMKKAEAEGVELPYEVAEYIAKRIRSNVRELEGCLIRLCAVSSITGSPITLETAQNVIKRLFPNSLEEELSVERIIQVVGDHFSVKPSEIKSRKRTKNIAMARQVAMYLARKLTTHSLPEIGEKFGGKDHTSVIYATKKVEKMLEESEQLREAVKKIEDRLDTL